MPPSVRSLMRRARRLGGLSPLLFLIRYIKQSQPSSPLKHIKIDDEERQLTDAQFERLYRPPQKFRMLLKILLGVILSVFVLAYIVYKPPSFVVSIIQWNNPDVLFHVPLPSTHRIMALTLDDAPSDETGKILDVLKAYRAKATFFVIGSQVAGREKVLQRIHDEGHEIGNHAWADEPSISLPLSELERQIKDVEDLIPTNEGGVRYFRPGSGMFSRKMMEITKRLKYNVILGDIFPFDPQIQNPKINAAHVLSMAKPGGVIILHDRRSYSPTQLELILKGLTSKGWRVDSVGGLLTTAEEIRWKKKGL